MAKQDLRLVRTARARNPIDEMQPGDLLMRLALISPQDYRAVITIARERYKQLWPYATDILTLKDAARR